MGLASGVVIYTVNKCILNSYEVGLPSAGNALVRWAGLGLSKAAAWSPGRIAQVLNQGEMS